MSSKKFVGTSNPLAGGGDAPPPLSVLEADSAIYGGGVADDIPRSGRVVAQPIDIMSIRPDLAQPRRVVPMVIRGAWRGDAGGAKDVLARWHTEAERLLGGQIDLPRRFEQVGEGMDVDNVHPIVDDYLALVTLAGSIRRDGLVNPITVIPQAGGYLIEGGERRWWAYQLLKSVFEVSDKYASIPAVKVDGKGAIWRQAAENGVRRPLNAVGNARQLSLLIMDMWRGRDGVQFDEYGFFSHDQQFYAQVKNGQTYPILKGQMERVLAVTGLKGKSQVAHYRALLSIPRDVWDEADMQNWAEGRIREMMQNTRQAEDRFTIVNLSGEKDGDKGHSPKSWGSDMPAPPPSIKSFGGDGRRVDAPVPMDEDDDEPMVVRPFASSPAPMLAPMPVDDYVPMEKRYVGGVLRHFVAWMIEHNIGAQDDVVGLRDCTPDRVRAWLGQYSQDEIAQMMSNWQMTVSEALVMVNNQMTETLDRIWEDVTNG